MLTDEDKNKILAEERFRQEVRTKLQETTAQPSPLANLFRFFNSNVGIWILSSVLVGFLSFAYTSWEQSKTNRVLVEKIDNEITARITRANGILQRGKQTQQLPKEIPLALEVLKGQDSLYPEFRDLPLIALLHKAKVLVPGSQEQEVLEAYALSKKLAQHEPDLRRKQTDEYFGEAVKEFAADWKRLVESERWGLKALIPPQKNTLSISAAKPQTSKPPAPKTRQIPKAPPTKNQNQNFMAQGDKLFHLGDYEGAAQAFKEAVGQRPQYHIPKFAYGHALIALGKFEGAVSSILQGLETYPSWPQEHWVNLLGFFPNQQEGEKALQRLKNWVKGNQKNRKAKFLLAYWYHFTNQRTQAKQLFQDLIKDQPEWSPPKHFL